MPVRDYQAELLGQLADPEYAALYLNASLDETLMDGDWEAFSLALEDVVKARQTTAEGGGDGDVAVQPLQRPLRNGEAPTLESLMAVLSSVGLAIDFKLA